MHLWLKVTSQDVASEGNGATSQDDRESDSSSELLANPVVMLEEEFVGFDKCLDAINEHIESSDAPPAKPMFKRRNKPGERAILATEASEEESTQSEKQQHQWPSSSQPPLHQQQSIPFFVPVPFQASRQVPCSFLSETSPPHWHPSSARASDIGLAGVLLTSGLPSKKLHPPAFIY